MKKIISLLLIFILLFLCIGCDQNEEATEQPTQTDQQTEQQTVLTETPPVRPTYKPSIEYGKIKDFGPTGIYRDELDAGYVSFEQNLNNRTGRPITDIVKATFLGVGNSGEHYYFFFQVNEIIEGEISDEIIAVQLYPTKIYFAGEYPKNTSSYVNVQDYKVRSNYLLLLNRYPRRENENEDILEFWRDCFLFLLDDKGEPIALQSKMYSQPLIFHIDDEDLKQRVINGELIECILELIQNSE